MAGRLAGKVTLISGTGSGIGRAAARLFAAAGATVVGSDVNSEAAKETVALVEHDGFTMTSVAPVDLSTPDGARTWIDAAVKAHGRIDVLYNNAGDTRFGPFAEMPAEDYEYTIRNELGVTWHCTQAVWPHLINGGGGAVVNCGSIAGISGSRDLPQAAHVAAKGAVMALTRQLAAEGARFNIRVNSVSPGLIGSPGVEAILENTPQLVMSMVDRTFNHRAGKPEEIAAAALFLASDESSYMTGSNIAVDGGTTSLI